MSFDAAEEPVRTPREAMGRIAAAIRNQIERRSKSDLAQSPARAEALDD
jgi:hypothetical protein